MALPEHDVGPLQANPQLEPSGPRQLRRSRQDRVLAGVCGGFGRYLNVDPVVLRIVMVALVFTGIGVPAYVIAWIAIPESGEGEPEASATEETRTKAAVVLGVGLVVLGGLLLVRSVLPWFDSAVFWPLVVVGGGVLLVLTARR